MGLNIAVWESLQIVRIPGVAGGALFLETGGGGDGFGLARGAGRGRGFAGGVGLGGQGCGGGVLVELDAGFEHS